MSAHVGVIGLGAMGLPVALRLLAAGHSVYGYELKEERLTSFTQQGGHAMPSVAALAQVCDTTLVFLVNAEQVRTVLLGADLAAAHFKPGSTIVVCATMSPQDSAELAAALAPYPIALLEAPVSGGTRGAEDGTLTLMVCGAADRLEQVRPVLSAISQAIYHFGPRYGDAAKVKLVNQLLVSVNLAAAAEAVAFATHEQLDLPLLYEVIQRSAGSSWAFVDRGPRLIQQAFEPTHTALSIFLKDLGLVLEQASAHPHPLPLAQTALGIFKAAAQMGGAQQDDTSILKPYLAALPLKGATQ